MDGRSSYETETQDVELVVQDNPSDRYPDNLPQALNILIVCCAQRPLLTLYAMPEVVGWTIGKAVIVMHDATVPNEADKTVSSSHSTRRIEPNTSHMFADSPNLLVGRRPAVLRQLMNQLVDRVRCCRPFERTHLLLSHHNRPSQTPGRLLQERSTQPTPPWPPGS